MQLADMLNCKLTEKQCHPFEVCSVDTASGDLWMMHNGTMNFMDITWCNEYK